LVRDEITFAEGLLLRGCRLICPAKLRNDVITYIHSDHQGIVKRRRRAYTRPFGGQESAMISRIMPPSVTFVEGKKDSEPLL